VVHLQEIMSRELVSIDAGAGFDEVAQLMASKGIRRLLVMDKSTGRGGYGSEGDREVERVFTKISTQIARLQSLPF